MVEAIGADRKRKAMRRARRTLERARTIERGVRDSMVDESKWVR